MSRIKKTGQSIKNQLEKNPEDKNSESSFSVSLEDLIEHESQQASKTVKLHAGKKKMTFYIPLDAEAKLNEVFAKRVMRNDKLDKSALIARAIHLLWKEDKNYEL